MYTSEVQDKLSNTFRHEKALLAKVRLEFGCVGSTAVAHAFDPSHFVGAV